jgi:hypothetical protein
MRRGVEPQAPSVIGRASGLASASDNRIASGRGLDPRARICGSLDRQTAPDVRMWRVRTEHRRRPCAGPPSRAAQSDAPLREPCARLAIFAMVDREQPVAACIVLQLRCFHLKFFIGRKLNKRIGGYN